DSTGWGRFVDAGTLRLLVTFGESRTRWNAPTAKELGFDIVSYSPYGLVGPKGMDAQVVKTLHDAFKKTLDDPEHLKLLQQLDQGIRTRRDRGYNATGHLAVGEPVEEICRLAKSLGVDLIVVGHNQNTSFAARWWKGSVGASLLDYSPCSIPVALSRM